MVHFLGEGGLVVAVVPVGVATDPELDIAPAAPAVHAVIVEAAPGVIVGQEGVYLPVADGLARDFIVVAVGTVVYLAGPGAHAVPGEALGQGVGVREARGLRVHPEGGDQLGLRGPHLDGAIGARHLHLVERVGGVALHDARAPDWRRAAKVLAGLVVRGGWGGILGQQGIAVVAGVWGLGALGKLAGTVAIDP